MLRLPHGVLGGGRVGVAPGVEVDGGVADRPDLVESLHAAIDLAQDVAAVVGGQGQLADEGVGLDPRAPDDGAGVERPAGGERHAARLDVVNGGLQQDLHAALLQVAGSVAGQVLVQRPQDSIAQLHEGDRHVARVHVAVPLARLPQEHVELPRQLHPREVAAHDHEMEKLASLGRAGGGVGKLQQSDGPIPQRHGVGEALYRPAVLAQARDLGQPGHAAQGDHEVVVAHAPVAGPADQAVGNLPLIQVGPHDLGHPELGGLEEGPHGHDGMTRLEAARPCLDEKRREHEVVVAVDEQDLDVAAAELSLEGLGAVRPREAAPEDHDALRAATHQRSVVERRSASRARASDERPLASVTRRA